MNKLVSIRAPIILLSAIKQISPQFTGNQSKVLVHMLKCGYLYQKYNCKEIRINIRTNGSVEQQVQEAYEQGLIHMAIAIIVTIITTAIALYTFLQLYSL